MGENCNDTKEKNICKTKILNQKFCSWTNFTYFLCETSKFCSCEFLSHCDFYIFIYKITRQCFPIFYFYLIHSSSLLHSSHEYIGVYFIQCFRDSHLVTVCEKYTSKHFYLVVVNFLYIKFTTFLLFRHKTIPFSFLLQDALH